MNRIMRLLALMLLCSVAVAVPLLWASWIGDGVPVCTATGGQYSPNLISDGAGGAIVAWYDLRNGNQDIYAHRIDASGVAQWTANGVPLCTETGSQNNPILISDGAGGAIVTWQDYRSGNNDIYANRIDASGVAQWTANGVPLCTATGGQYSPDLTSDGAGGAIVTWEDLRSGSRDIYAQRIDASGTVQWIPDGVPLCTATNDQFIPRLISDGAGGAIVTWYDFRNGSWETYAQRINASGTVQWIADGVPLCTATGPQYYPNLISDGAGGAIVTWQDYRSGSWDIYAQRIDASGTVQWTADGVPLCTATGDQGSPNLISDGAGGAIVTWQDCRSGSWDIYAQRIDASSVVQWTANGVPLCTATGDQYSPNLISDGAGGAILTWEDLRSGIRDIYAQRIDALGVARWTANGVALCTATENQNDPNLISDGAGGAIVTWYDYRSGDFDIYAQQVDSSGRIGYRPPVIHSVNDVPGDEGGFVNLTWYATPLDYLSGEITEYTVWRALNTQAAQSMIESGSAIIASPAKATGTTTEDGGKAILRLASLNGEMFFWKLISTLDAYRLQGYSEIAATLFDSTAVCDDFHYFQVIAHTSDPAIFYVSDPDSGYSVDNLAPAAPAKLAGVAMYSPVGLRLTWERNSESDMDHYKVYRGLSEDFKTDPGTLIASPNDTTSLDLGWSMNGGYYYKVSAIDIHGNESSFALLSPDETTGVETPGIPNAAYLGQNYPNPFNPATTIAFGLERSSHVSLNVYDMAGRLVRVIFEGDRPAGRYTEIWDGKDRIGRAVSSGVYFYRLNTGSITQTRNMILLK